MVNNENAASRKNYCSELYNSGVTLAKELIKNNINEKYKKLHNDGYLHIHDLEGYGKVYNCSMPFILHKLVNEIEEDNDHKVIMQCFSLMKNIICEIAVCQTGGIGFHDIDSLISLFLLNKKIKFTKMNQLYIKDCMYEFIQWINITKTRYCREPYYVTFNLGLDETKWGRYISSTILTIIKNNKPEYIRPNVVFKVKRSVNFDNESKNHDILLQALDCAAKRMIPNFLLMDSEPNKAFHPSELGIMGCRTRVVANRNGNTGTLGRGNIATVAINLPRLALESKNIDDFKEKLNEMMTITNEILLDRVSKMTDYSKEYLEYIFENKYWNNVSDISDMIKQGTLSIGFIGLSETVEILTGEKFYITDNGKKLGLEIIKYMKDFTDNLSNTYNLNYSLLASAGELISGRFCEIDKALYNHEVHEKGFYTNSFHVNVDSNISLFQKIELEAPYHMLCNGGCITYIEFREAPFKNVAALLAAIDYSINKGISYLAFNFPMDVCNECGKIGTFNTCTYCGSSNIKRIRRVSGYLEDLTFFTKGKKEEVCRRTTNYN